MARQDIVGFLYRWRFRFMSVVIRLSYQTSAVRDYLAAGDWHVTRGGGWNNGLYHSTSYFRRGTSSGTIKAFIGFRCVR